MKHAGSRGATSLVAVVLLVRFFTLPALGAQGDSIDPSLIPDGTYPAHVERIINPRQIEVTMQSTLKVFLSTGRPNLSDKLKPNDDITVTLTDGKVVAFGKKHNQPSQT